MRRTIAILGGGSAGLTAARTAARLGARVLLFMGEHPDRASLCVNRGCMPSKAMFEPIDAFHHARRWGLVRVEPVVPERLLGQIVAWKDREIARFRAFRQQAIADHESDDFVVVRAAARFVDAHTLEAAGRRHAFDAVILATGSTGARPPVPGLADLASELWDSEQLLSNTRLPGSAVFIGAGAIGLEFALRYARLGCRVTMVARSHPLSAYPESFGRRLAAIYESEGVRVLTETAVRRVRRDTEGWFIVETEGPAGREPLAAERVVLAAGRLPALDTLALEAAGIERDERGRLCVGEDMRVLGHDHVFAAGDVIGRRMVVHQAHIEAGIAAENAVSEGAREWKRAADIQVVYSDPQFAYAGLTPEQARADGKAIVSAAKESRLVGKLHLAGDDHGFGELFADAESGRLLGAGLLCDAASELIHLPAYLIQHAHTVHQGAGAEYYHPTRIEIIAALLDELCRGLGGHPPRRADEKTG